MLMAAAQAIAACAKGHDLVPNPLDREVHAAVTAAVREAWKSSPGS
jgi:malate dehydrogenase (oxaloacetate-decarboxylating)